MKYYLDEDISPQLAAVLRRLGCPASSTQEAGNRGASDEEQLDYAAEIGHALVTRNRDDFLALTNQFLEDSRPHPGVVIIPRSIPNGQIRLLAALLLRFAALYPTGLEPYTLVFLNRA